MTNPVAEIALPDHHAWEPESRHVSTDDASADDHRLCPLARSWPWPRARYGGALGIGGSGAALHRAARLVRGDETAGTSLSQPVWPDSDVRRGRSRAVRIRG